MMTDLESQKQASNFNYKTLKIKSQIYEIKIIYSYP